MQVSARTVFVFRRVSLCISARIRARVKYYTESTTLTNNTILQLLSIIDFASGVDFLYNMDGQYCDPFSALSKYSASVLQSYRMPYPRLTNR